MVSLPGEEDAGIGEYDGEWSLALMRGVRHKAALLLPRLLRRLEGQSGEHQRDDEETAQGQRPHQQRGADQRPQ